MEEHRVEVFKVCQQERVSECVVEQCVAVPQLQENVREVFKVIPQPHVSERIVVPQILEQSVEVVGQERVSERIVVQIVAVPHIQEHAVGVFKVTPTLGLISSFGFL